MNGNDTGSTGTQRASGYGNGTSMIDDFLRRALRVGDPSNPQEVALALRRRYAQEALKLDDESKGFSIGTDLSTIQVSPTERAGDTPGDRVYVKTRNNLEADLDALVNAPGNRDWRPELTGWRSTLLREYEGGAAAARFAQDPAQRERAFFSVRRLGEYARLARLVGVMNLEVSYSYRRLATTLDGCASVLRVLMGQTLNDAGLGDGGVIIQVPLTDLRQRRDALMTALRRLTGLADDNGDGDWGTDAASYRSLLDALSKASAPELRVYLREEMLSQILDGLLAAVSRQDPEALRQLAATAQVEINRLGRLLQITSGVIARSLAGDSSQTVSSALSSFAQSLGLFVEAFDNSRSGSRLVDLAVPLPFVAMQYNNLDVQGREILRGLVNLRGDLAREVECFLGCCGCGPDQLRRQVKLDKVLYDVDRAIDLYAQGTGLPPQWGEEEKRAAIHGHVAGNLAMDLTAVTASTVFPVLADAARAGLDMLETVQAIAERIGADNGDATATTVGQKAKSAREALAAAVGAADVYARSKTLADSDLSALVALVTPPTTTPSDAKSVVATAASQSSLVGAVQIVLDASAALLGPLAVKISRVTPNNPTASGFVADLLRQLAPTTYARAMTALTASTTALIAALGAVGDTHTAADRAKARTYASQLSTQIDYLKADLSALPPNPLDAGSFSQRVVTTAALEAASAAYDVAGRAGSIPDQDAGEPTALYDALTQIATLIATPQLLDFNDAAQFDRASALFEEQARAEEDWKLLVGSLAPRCLGPGRADLVLAGRELLHGSIPNVRAIKFDPLVPPPVPDALRVGIDRLGHAQVTSKSAAQTDLGALSRSIESGFGTLSTDLTNVIPRQVNWANVLESFTGALADAIKRALPAAAPPPAAQRLTGEEATALHGLLDALESALDRMGEGAKESRKSSTNIWKSAVSTAASSPSGFDKTVVTRVFGPLAAAQFDTLLTEFPPHAPHELVEELRTVKRGLLLTCRSLVNNAAPVH